MREFEQKESDKINYALLIDPEMLYPVSYIIKQSGEKQLVPTVLLGKDLTENQIKELIEKKIVHIGYVPMSIYTTTRAELDKAKQTVAELHVGMAEFRKSVEKTEAELDTVKAELERGWQPVTDELPKMEVLCVDQYDEYHIGYLGKTPDGIFICESNTEILENPTHYKTLPTPPHKN